MQKREFDWRGRIPRAAAAAFLCCFAAGYITHLYAFTNIIPNADGLSRVSDAQQMTISGRWFLHYATVFNGFVQSPAVIGFFSVLFLSLAAALTVSLLGIRNPVLGGLTGVLMVVFPPVASTFLFLFTASAYSFGILLAVLAVWLTARSRRGAIPAVLLLACAVGTYQAYLAVAVSLALCSVLLFALEKGRSAREIVLFGLRHLAVLVLGLLVYYGTLRVFLRVKDLTLLDYKGISATGSGGLLLQALSLVGAAYKGFVNFFFRVRRFASYTTPFAVWVNAGFALVGLWAFLRCALRGELQKRPGALALVILLCALLPLGLNLTVLMGDVRDVMRYPLVFTYVLALALTDRVIEAETLRPRALAAAAVCVSVLISLFSLNIDNVAYTASATAHRASESFATRLVERVESTPGYQNGMDVIIVGSFPREVYGNSIEVFRLMDAPTDSILTLNKHIYYYLNDWLNVPWPEPDEATLQAVSDSDFFQAMPLYPDDGSIAIIDGRVIVRLADHYRPKQLYEIQYENRR